MAPRKRKAEGEDGSVKPVLAPSTRVTRSSTRLAYPNSAVPPPELPKKKKGKAAGKKEKAESEKKEDIEAKVDAENVENKEEFEEETVEDASKKTIVIEHCKQCTSFKTRAIQVKNGLENSVPGVTVLLNPEKPRKGCFEIREEDGEKFISLLDMKRPFKPMKDLDMERVISDIIDKIKP